MKSLKKCLQVMLVMMAVLFTPIIVKATEFKEIPVTIDGVANEVTFAEGVHCSFTPASDGTMSLTCTAETKVKFLAIKKYNNDVPSFMTWIESGILDAGENKSKDFNVVAGQKYAIEIEGASDNDSSKVSLTLSLKADETISEITFGKTEYRVVCGDRLDFSDIKISPADVKDKDLEWDYDENGFHYYNNNSFLTEQPGVYTLTAKSTKSDAKASVKVMVVPPEVSNVRQDTLKSTQKEIIVEWNAFDNIKVDGYNVYMYDDSKKTWKLCGSTGKNKLNVGKLKTEKKYKFKVVAFIKDGKEQIEGEAGKPTTLYTAPKNVAATTITSFKTSGSSGSDNYVIVSWKKVKNATGYRVYGCAKGDQFKLLSTETGTRSDYVAGRGYTYSFKVVAFRTKNNLTTDAKASGVKNYTSK